MRFNALNRGALNRLIALLCALMHYKIKVHLIDLRINSALNRFIH